MIKPGKKTKEWNKVRGQLKKEFEAMGITTCEIKLDSFCFYDRFLSFAHTAKRRDVTDLKRVVLACQNCHQKVEYQCERYTGQTMGGFLEGIITHRNVI